MIRREVLVGRENVVYWEKNPSGAMTLIMLHGFRGSHEGLTYLSEYIRDYHLVIPDRPGYGESSPLALAHTLENYANWLELFVEALGVNDYALWGHSYGASISLIHSARCTRKPTAVIGVTPAILRGGAFGDLTTFYYRFAQILPERLAKSWLTSRSLERITDSVLFSAPRTERPESLKAVRDRERITLRPKVIVEEYLSSVAFDLLACAPVIEIPVLLIAGSKDPIVPVRKVVELAGYVPNGQLKVLANQGHMLPIERPRIIAGITQRFLDDLWNPA